MFFSQQLERCKANVIAVCYTEYNILLFISQEHSLVDESLVISDAVDQGRTAIASISTRHGGTKPTAMVLRAGGSMGKNSR